MPTAKYNSNNCIVFRRSFWTSSHPDSRRRSSTLPVHHAPRYLFPQPLPHLEARINRCIPTALNSTSRGISTEHSWNEAEFGNREYELEDSDNRVDVTTTSGGDRSSEDAKKLEDRKRKRQQGHAIEIVGREPTVTMEELNVIGNKGDLRQSLRLKYSS